MLKLEEITKDTQIRGILPEEIVRIIQVDPVGDGALTVYYKVSQGGIGEQMLFRFLWLTRRVGRETDEQHKMKSTQPWRF